MCSNALRFHPHNLSERTWQASPVATVQAQGYLSKFVCAFVCLLRYDCRMNGKAAATVCYV